MVLLNWIGEDGGKKEEKTDVRKLEMAWRARPVFFYFLFSVSYWAKWDQWGFCTKPCFYSLYFFLIFFFFFFFSDEVWGIIVQLFIIHWGLHLDGLISKMTLIKQWSEDNEMMNSWLMRNNDEWCIASYWLMHTDAYCTSLWLQSKK